MYQSGRKLQMSALSANFPLHLPALINRDDVSAVGCDLTDGGVLDGFVDDALTGKRDRKPVEQAFSFMLYKHVLLLSD